MNEDKLENSIVWLLKQNEKKLLELIEKEMASSKLEEIKNLGDIIKAIKNLVSFQGLRTISDAVIKNTFMIGWDTAEKQLDKNLMINKDAVTFIQDYTFNNIVDLTEEIKNDLRAELERGIMNNEGITNIKKRIMKVFDVGENRADMIARTETNRAENQGKLQAFKSSTEDFSKRWVAHKDERTSAICMRLNGQIVGMNENFKDATSGCEGPVPPSHVNCRSTVIFLSEEETQEQKDLKQKELSDEMDMKMKIKEMEIKERKET